MHYLYGSKPGVPRKLVATFSSEQQRLAYVSWATLSVHDGVHEIANKAARSPATTAGAMPTTF